MEKGAGTLRIWGMVKGTESKNKIEFIVCNCLIKERLYDNMEEQMDSLWKKKTEVLARGKTNGLGRSIGHRC